MKPQDLLLVAAAACLVAAGTLVAPALGFLAAAAALAGAWYLLGEA